MIKRLLITFTAALLLTSCIFVEEDSECERTSDCGFNERCAAGVCEYVPGKPPGYITVGCNCSTTNLYPGQVRNNNTCESGQDVVGLCGFACCDAFACYGQAWGAVCL